MILLVFIFIDCLIVNDYMPVKYYNSGGSAKVVLKNAMNKQVSELSSSYKALKLISITDKVVDNDSSLFSVRLDAFYVQKVFVSTKPVGRVAGSLRRYFKPQSSRTYTSFRYSSWGTCLPNGTQRRSVFTKLPENCFGGNPVTTRSGVFAPRKAKLYVIDGTNSTYNNNNALYHFYAAWSGLKEWEDGVNLVASDLDLKYSKVYSKVCRDVQTGAVGDIYLLGFSRGAVMTVRLANEVRINCNAKVRFIGIVDAVNTGMNLINPIWSTITKLNPGVPYATHFRKRGNYILGFSLDGPLTTFNIAGMSPVYHSKNNITHNQLVCSCENNLNSWKETLNSLKVSAQNAGGLFSSSPPLITKCGLKYC